VGLKRFSLLAVLAAVLTLGITPSASAGNFDEERMGCTGENPATCPTATTGTPYSLPIELGGDEDEACAVYSVTSGSLPTGLSLTRDVVNETGYGLISGTPTQAGTYDFYLTVTYNREVACPFKNPSDDSFRITVNPGLAKLTIGPESTTPGTAGSPYSLQMTATVSEPKTWSIVAGSLPSGLALDSTTGLISGTPTAAGSFPFTVLAKMNGDARSDTKALTIDVRAPLAIKATKPLGSTSATVVWEVGVPFAAKMSASGGSGTYTWTVAAGALPAGLGLSPDGTIAGTPEEAGGTKATIRLADSEGRALDYPMTFGVAKRLVISTLLLKVGRVGRPYQAKVATTGGIKPVSWKLKTTKRPKGILFDPATGTLLGIPSKAGVYRLTFEATDTLRVTAVKTLRLFVAP
jgi:hypothetical protein